MKKGKEETLEFKQHLKWTTARAKSRLEKQKRHECENGATEMITREEEKAKGFKEWTVSDLQDNRKCALYH